MGSLSQKIRELLVKKKIIDAKKLQKVLTVLEEEGGELSSLLVENKLIKKQALLEFIKENFRFTFIDITKIKIMPELTELIDRDTIKQYSILPLKREGDNLTLGFVDPLSALDLDTIEAISGYEITPVTLSRDDFTELVKSQFSFFKGPAKNKPRTMDDILNAAPEVSIRPLEEVKLSELTQATQEVPIIKATNYILNKAIESKASDILIEPLENMTRVRFRTDGIFHQAETLPRSFHPFIVSRIKVISDLDIAEHRLPQDGQFEIELKDRNIDLRVSIFPTVGGEKVAIRILDKATGMLDINKLGFREDALKKLKETAFLPHGMILACGPTGSGKTSTLYSLIRHIHTPEKNIVTVEDPVEYQVRGINQVSVNQKIGLGFGRCLRSILRQDPDVIMIGEIRDFETADIAIKSALTGHLVLSTLHTTTTCGSVLRLADMGIEPFLISASLICVVAHRLARRICLECKEQVPGQSVFRGRGCERCFETGYSGRILIPEILHMSPTIREIAITERLNEVKIKEAARAEGMKTLREEGEEMVRRGITTMEEIQRVTPAD